MPKGIRGFQKGHKINVGRICLEETRRKIGEAQKGKIISDESKKKSSRSHLGNKQSEETKRKISKATLGKSKPWLVGRKLSDKRREKIRIANTGRICSKETRRKIGEAQRGEKGNNWKGGITPLMYQVRNLFECKNWKKKVFKRDRYICQCSGAKSGNGKAIYLEVHHIKGFAIILEENDITTIKQALECKELWDISNGITLLKKVHRKFHKIYGIKNNSKEQLEEFLNCKIKYG